MKKHIQFIIAVFALVTILTIIPSIDSYTANKKEKSKVTYSLKKGVLTIKGKGKMPKSMTFKRNKKIKKVIIKKGVTSISYKAFYKCKNLKEVKIANTVKKIGALSFSETKIKKITIPKSVTTIGEEALSWCDKLTEITMPGSFDLKFAAEACYSEITVGCRKLKTINFNTNFDIKISKCCGGTRWNVRKKDPNYKSIDGIIYSKDGKEIVRVPAGRKVLKVAEGCEVFCLQSISYRTEFYDDSEFNIGCAGLRKIVLPKSIRQIENQKYVDDYAISDTFYMNLQEIEIKSKQINEESIYTLHNFLKRIYRYSLWSESYPYQNIDTFAKIFPDRIKKDGDFYILDETILYSYNGDDETITIPEYIEKIGAYAFESIEGEQKKITIEGDTTRFPENI